MNLQKIFDFFKRKTLRQEGANEYELAVDLGQSYRLQMWTNKVLLVAILASTALNIFLGLCIFVMTPLTKIQPMLLTTNDKAEQIVKVQPFQVESDGKKLLSQKMAIKYVTKRETVDLSSEEERYKVVKALSTYDVFSDFKNFVEKDQTFLKKAKSDKLTRSVVINSVSWLSDQKLYVEYDAIDSHFGNEVDRRKMVAIVTFDYMVGNVKNDDIYLNPLGWTVTQYSLTIKEEKGRKEDENQADIH
ncbi:MAG: type IV secretion system protein [Candidatus Levybacteria bacterium]|jgi:type IV secretion system protein VirB8|nr:type IV secretion system protein [Candidatus Levybacteria bacterium]